MRAAPNRRLVGGRQPHTAGQSIAGRQASALRQSCSPTPALCGAGSLHRRSRQIDAASSSVDAAASEALRK